MSGYPKDLEEAILFCAGYALSPLVAAAGAYASGCVIAGYRTARDVIKKQDYSVEVFGHRGNKSVRKRHLGIYELYVQHLTKDLGLDRKNEM